MMKVFARMQVGGGPEHELVPGDIVGRIWSAALRVSDPLVSEAHAMVSLREGRLKLVGLRGKLVVDNKVVPEVLLSNGLRITLSRNTTLEVGDVEVPEALFAIDHPDLGSRIISGVCSLVYSPSLTLVPGAQRDAFAVFWSDGVNWFVRQPDQTDLGLMPGEELDIGGVVLGVSLVVVGNVGESTVRDATHVEPPLRLVARYDTFHIHRPRWPSVAVNGMAARILSELAIAEVPMPWHVVATEIWPEEADMVVLRRNWDAALARLRKKLKAARIRLDLVRSDRSGNFEIFLQTGDRIEDLT